MAHHRNVEPANVSTINGSKSLWLARTLECYEVEEIDIRQLARYLATHPIVPEREAATGTYDD
ncbi:MAG: hypothetical protein WCA32_02385 [Chromatiaceae bacterium]|jgi:hypothetical protein